MIAAKKCGWRLTYVYYYSSGLLLYLSMFPLRIFEILEQQLHTRVFLGSRIALIYQFVNPSLIYFFLFSFIFYLYRTGNFLFSPFYIYKFCSFYYHVHKIILMHNFEEFY